MLICRGLHVEESPYKAQLLGLNLLRLLSENRLSDFHTVSFCIYRVTEQFID